jgi:hypothetical protein
MPRICVDACFLIGLYDETDQHHRTANLHFNALFGEESGRHQLVAPWPILYECLGTRFARHPLKSVLLNQHWNYLSQAQQLVLLDDHPFREASLGEHLQERSRQLSLVDRVIRAMILDQTKQFDFFLTYNTGDFADACQLSGVQLINEHIPAESYGI